MTSRLGPGDLQQEFGIRPDMTTLGKCLGDGLTIGAFGGRAEIMDRFDPRRVQCLVHSGTFNNNILSMTAGYAAMSQVFTPDAASRLNQEGEKLRARLNGLAAKAGLPMQFTGRGSMMTTHFSVGPIRAPADATRGDACLRELFYFDLLEAGIWPARRGMLNLSLPMTEVEHGILEQAIASFIESRRGLFDDHEAGSSDG